LGRSLCPDTVLRHEALERTSGDGWQTRVDTVLRDWLKDHSPVK